MGCKTGNRFDSHFRLKLWLGGRGYSKPSDFWLLRLHGYVGHERLGSSLCHWSSMGDVGVCKPAHREGLLPSLQSFRAPASGKCADGLPRLFNRTFKRILGVLEMDRRLSASAELPRLVHRFFCLSANSGPVSTRSAHQQNGASSVYLLRFVLLWLELYSSMNPIVAITVFLASFFIMEFAAWFTHKYVMHGLLWYLHKDHHQKEPGFFEKNDSFFLIFAIPSWLFIMYGMMHGNDWKLFYGLGILAYGTCYFLVHDVLIHKRFDLFQNIRHPYFKAIIRAHQTHHRVRIKEGASCFGMLWVPMEFFKREQSRRKQSAV